ncbi:hypothetical protein Tco_0120650 [Tanacetum coccineum]
MKERVVQAIKEIEKWLKEREIHQQESLVTEGTTLEANLSTDGTPLDASSVIEGASLEAYLVTKGAALEANLVTEGITLDASLVTKKSTVDSSTSSAHNTVSEVHHDLFENMYVNGIQNHNLPKSIPNTYVVNENNSNIMYDIPNMDPDRDKAEHDYVDDEQQRAYFASLINNLKFDVEKCTKVNCEAQQANALLTKELERYKEKEKHFAKDKKIESEYCKKIKLLNDEISNLKS